MPQLITQSYRISSMKTENKTYDRLLAAISTIVSVIGLILTRVSMGENAPSWPLPTGVALLTVSVGLLVLICAPQLNSWGHALKERRAFANASKKILDQLASKLDDGKELFTNDINWSLCVLISSLQREYRNDSETASSLDCPLIHAREIERQYYSRIKQLKHSRGKMTKQEFHDFISELLDIYEHFGRFVVEPLAQFRKQIPVFPLESEERFEATKKSVNQHLEAMQSLFREATRIHTLLNGKRIFSSL